MPDLQSQEWGTGPSPRDFEQIRRLARETFGLDLKAGKESLIAARLGKMMRELNIPTFEQYCRYVTSDTSGEAITGMIDALTTNFTSFFREQSHFDFLNRTFIPSMKNSSQIRVWSAACSTGEEPYSLAFTFMDAGRIASTEIVATDISTKVLRSAEQGIYEEEKIKDIKESRKYFLKGHGKWAGYYCVKPEIRKIVRFQRMNLMENFTVQGTFDLIACRNVMIYFDRATQHDLVTRMVTRLNTGGYLLIGHSESLNGFKGDLKYIAPAIYRKSK